MSHTNVKIIADTLGNAGARITTFEVFMPRFLLAEVNTHRAIAKSAASSRAIPVKKRIEMVNTMPFIPDKFGKNQPGMQASENLTEQDNSVAAVIWRGAIDDALKRAEALNAVNTHKQQANRVIEPYTYVSVVLTGTEWDHFFNLRAHPDAQPEFQEVAYMMKEAYKKHYPRASSYHLPYTDGCDPKLTLETLFYISSARCARVSYKTFDGRTSGETEDIELCRSLIKSGHLSPFDHPASIDFVYQDEAGAFRWNNPEQHRQYWGWIPYRVSVEKNLGMTCRRSSWAPIPRS